MQSDQSHCKSLEYYINVQLLAEQNFEFLSLKGGCTGWSESTLVEMPHGWNSHVALICCSLVYFSTLKVSGKEITPFILQRVNELTGGRSLESSILAHVL